MSEPNTVTRRIYQQQQKKTRNAYSRLRAKKRKMLLESKGTLPTPKLCVKVAKSSRKAADERRKCKKMKYEVVANTSKECSTRSHPRDNKSAKDPPIIPHARATEGKTYAEFCNGWRVGSQNYEVEVKKEVTCITKTYQGGFKISIHNKK